MFDKIKERIDNLSMQQSITLYPHVMSSILIHFTSSVNMPLFLTAVHSSVAHDHTTMDFFWIAATILIAVGIISAVIGFNLPIWIHQKVFYLVRVEACYLFTRSTLVVLHLIYNTRKSRRGLRRCRH